MRMTQESAETRLQREAEPQARRNMGISVTEGVLDAVAMGMIPLNTVVTYFISDYVNNSFVLGLLPTLQSVCNALVQVFLSERLRSVPRFKPLCTLGTTLSRLSWLVLSLLILFFSRMQPLYFVCVFYGVYCFNGLCQGITSLTYTQMMNKVIPDRMKGRFFGVRGAFTSAASILGAQVGGAILASNGDVRRFGVLFLVAFVLDMLSAGLQALTREPRLRMKAPEKTGARPGFFAESGRILKADGNFARYVLAMFLITIGMSFFNFQTAQSKDALGLTAGQLAWVTTILYVFQTGGHLVFGVLSDRRGYRPALLLGQAGFALYLLLAFFARDARLTYIMTAIYGLANAANALGARNMVFHLCPYEERVGYYAVMNMALTVSAAAASMVTGALIDWIGYGPSAIACLGLTLPGLLLLLRVRETPENGGGEK